MSGRGSRRKAAGGAGEIAAALARACGALEGDASRPALIPAGASVLVACSGGADSTALAAGLAGLARARRELRLRVALGHVDHGLRAESVGEARSVRALAAALGAEFFLETLAPSSLDARIAEQGLEAAAREARYAALERLALTAGCGFVATAHTRRDQAETVLLRLSRGGGLSALAGVRASRALGAVRLVRPLLGVSRAATEALCRERALSYSSDPHNLDPRRSRARVRASLEHLADLLNPRLEEALAASARIAAEEDEVLDAAARAALVPVLKTDARDSASAAEIAAALRLEPLAALPDALLRRALLLAASARGARPERAHLEKICTLIRRGQGNLDLPGGRAIVRAGSLDFQIGNERKLPRAAPPAPLRIDGPGVYQWGALRLEIAALTQADAATAEPPLSEHATPALFVDLSRAPMPWTVRSHAPGDRFRPAGGRAKKVSELWIDARVPQEERVALPLLADANGSLFFVARLRPGDVARLRPREAAHRQAVEAAITSGGLSVSLRFFPAEGASFGTIPSLVEQRAGNPRATIPASIDEELR